MVDGEYQGWTASIRGRWSVLEVGIEYQERTVSMRGGWLILMMVD